MVIAYLVRGVPVRVWYRGGEGTPTMTTACPEGCCGLKKILRVELGSKSDDYKKKLSKRKSERREELR